MPSLEHLARLAQDALVLSLAVSLPIVLIAALVGFLVASLQAATQIQDATIAHLPRLLAIVFGLIVLGPWMGRELASFAARVLQGG